MSASGRSGEQATLRGALVLVAAVVVGLALLSRSSSGALIGPTEAGGSKPSSTTTAPPKTLVPANVGTTQPPVTQPSTSSTVPPTTHPMTSVKIVVVNATGGKAGVGSTNADRLKAAGFNQPTVSNANAAPTTTVYFAAGYQGDAGAVKQAANLGGAPVAPAPALPIVGAAAGANVVLVLGQDYQG